MNGPMIVDGHVIFGDGTGRPLTKKEKQSFAAGTLKQVPVLSARFTPIGWRDE